MASRTARIGDDVLFVLKDGAHRPGVIVDVSDDVVQLNVHLTPRDKWGSEDAPSNLVSVIAGYDEAGTKPHTWHYRERL